MSASRPAPGLGYIVVDSFLFKWSLKQGCTAYAYSELVIHILCIIIMLCTNILDVYRFEWDHKDKETWIRNKEILKHYYTLISFAVIGMALLNICITAIFLVGLKRAIRRYVRIYYNYYLASMPFTIYLWFFVMTMWNVVLPTLHHMKRPIVLIECILYVFFVVHFTCMDYMFIVIRTYYIYQLDKDVQIAEVAAAAAAAKNPPPAAAKTVPSAAEDKTKKTAKTVPPAAAKVDKTKAAAKTKK